MSVIAINNECNYYGNPDLISLRVNDFRKKILEDKNTNNEYQILYPSEAFWIFTCC